MNFTIELDSQRKLVDLYKKYFDEATQKIEELESVAKASKEAHMTVVVQLQSKLKAQQENSDSLMERVKQESMVAINELEERLRKQEDASKVGVDSVCDAMSHEGLLSLNVTEMYDKVVEAQKELSVEKSKRREAELYLNRIFKEIENKTPTILSQRREFNRLVESHALLTRQLDDAIVDISRLKSSLNVETVRAASAERDMALIAQQNTDLASQVQHLLKRTMEQSHGGRPVALIGYDENSASAADIISDRLVTFSDVSELHSRNMQLLQVVRKLSEEQERAVEGEREAATSELQDSLQQAMQELQAMRESRQRTEDMVRNLVQQRDMYRAIVEEEGEGDKRMPAAIDRDASSTPGRNSMGRQLQQESEMRAGRLEEENKRLVDRISRLEEGERAAREALDKGRSESLSLRVEAAHATSDAAFQKERCDKLEDAIKSARIDLEAAANKRSELQALLLSFQQESRGKDDRLMQLQDELRSANENARRLQVDREVAVKAEERLVTQLAELKEDFKKQASVGDSIRKIEQGLSGQKEEELSKLNRERESLIKSVEALRKELSDNSIISEQRYTTLEAETKGLRQRLELKVQEYSVLKEDYIREQSALVSTRERSAVLEKQLNHALEQLGGTQGSQVLDSIATSQLAQNEVTLERALSEAESLSAQLATAEQHVEQYKRISTANESLLNDVRQKFQTTKIALEDELGRVSGELEAAKRESSERRVEALDSMREAEAARNELQELVKMHADETRLHSEALTIAEDKASLLTHQLLVLKEDVARYEKASKEAQDNYRREVTMHSKTTEDIFILQKQLDEGRSELSKALESNTNLSAQVFRLEMAIDDEKRGHVGTLKELQNKVDDLQATNNILHGQIQTLGAQINRFQENRGMLANNASSGSFTSDEVSGLHTAAAELREVIRYMKREQDVLEAKLSIADSENSRLKISLGGLQRALDEAKVELSRELDKRVVSRGEDEFARLLAEVNQLNVVRESNSHLRSENEELGRKAVRLSKELMEIKDKEAPLLEQVRVLSLEKMALENERTALMTDVGYWRDRLHQLVTRYNEVDPEEHRILQTKLEESISKTIELTAAVEASTAEIATLRANETVLVTELVSIN
jgi:nucleoprotein TPR